MSEWNRYIQIQYNQHIIKLKVKHIKSKMDRSFITYMKNAHRIMKTRDYLSYLLFQI